MAHLSTTWCSYCQKETNHLNNKCVACACRLAREEKAIWHSKTNEEKINELLKRIEVLEAGPIRYS